MNPLVRSVRDFCVSLRLTVILLALSLILVFASTLAQVDLGIYAVQEEFYRSFVAIWQVGGIFIPLPGGYLVGGLLLIKQLEALEEPVDGAAERLGQHRRGTGPDRERASRLRPRAAGAGL